MPAKNRVAKDRDLAPACPPAAIWEADAGARRSAPSRPIPPRIRVITRLGERFAPEPGTSAISGGYWRETAGAPPLRTAVPEPGLAKARVWMRPSNRLPALTVLPARLVAFSMQATERPVAEAPGLKAGVPEGVAAAPLFPVAIQVERAALARLADGIALDLFPCRIAEPELARTGPRFAFDSVLPAGMHGAYGDARLHQAANAAAMGWRPGAEGLKPKNGALAPILPAAAALPPRVQPEARYQPGMPSTPNEVWLAACAAPALERCREDGPFAKPVEMGLPAVRKPSAEPAALVDSGFTVWTRSSNRYRRTTTALESRGPRAEMALPQIRYAMRFGDMLGSGLKKNRPSAD